MVKRLFLILCLCLIVIPLCSAELQVGIGRGINDIGINFDPIEVPTNFSTISVNHSDSSDFTNCWVTSEGIKCDVVDILSSEITNDLGWMSGSEVDSSYLNKSGSNANLNIDIGIYNFSAGTINATGSILMNYLNSATYTTIQDWRDTTQSSGWISGGNFTDNGDGSLNVSAGTGIIRTEDNKLAPTYFFDWTENASITLTDDTTNYIYIDINGGTPDVKVTLDQSDINGRTRIGLGQIFREGTTLHTLRAGMAISDIPLTILKRLNAIDGDIVRASGYVVAETGERFLTTTNGIIYGGYTRIITTGIDTSGADDMETYYRDGGVGWIEFDSSQINNSHWDDGTGTLNTLTPNRYGVHWIYGDADGHLMLVWGQGDYTLALAEASQPPSSLPNHVEQFGFLAAKVIVKEGETNLLAVQSAYDIVFTPSGASVHNELSGLQGGTGDEYYHFTNSEHTELSEWLPNVVLSSGGDISMDDTLIMAIPFDIAFIGVTGKNLVEMGINSFLITENLQLAKNMLFTGNGNIGTENAPSLIQLTDNSVTINSTLKAFDWTNVSITESQISDLTHTIDTSAFVNCSTDEVFLGNGSCQTSTDFISVASSSFFETSGTDITNNSAETFSMTNAQAIFGGFGDEEVTNGNFTGSGTGWIFTGGCSYSLGQAVCTDDGTVKQNGILENNTRYTFSSWSLGEFDGAPDLYINGTYIASLAQGHPLDEEAERVTIFDFTSTGDSIEIRMLQDGGGYSENVILDNFTIMEVKEHDFSEGDMKVRKLNATEGITGVGDLVGFGDYYSSEGIFDIYTQGDNILFSGQAQNIQLYTDNLQINSVSLGSIKLSNDGNEASLNLWEDQDAGGGKWQTKTAGNEEYKIIDVKNANRIVLEIETDGDWDFKTFNLTTTGYMHAADFLTPSPASLGTKEEILDNVLNIGRTPEGELDHSTFSADKKLIQTFETYENCDVYQCELEGDCEEVCDIKITEVEYLSSGLRLNDVEIGIQSFYDKYLTLKQENILLTNQVETLTEELCKLNPGNKVFC